nr:hypothetical protein [Methylobacterium sp. ZNC0032]
MRTLAPILAGLLAASVTGAFVAQAQTVSSPAKQRSPNVPMAPRAEETARPAPPSGVAPREEKRGGTQDRAQVRPERDPPMPKPVPSIIAP